MDITLCLVNGIGSGRGVAKRLFIDLNEKPEEEETIDPDDQPMVSASTLLHSYVDPGCHKADMAVSEQKDMVALEVNLK